MEPVIIGHRANSRRIVELYRIARTRWVEVDVRVRGGVPIVGHGPPATRRATPVGRLFAWIDYKLFYRDPIIGYSPLHSWLRLLEERLPLEGVLLDLKAWIPPERLRAEIERSGISASIALSTEDHRHIPTLREAFPGAQILASYSIMPADIVECTLRARATGVSLRYTYATRDTVEALHRAGLTVYTWTVNDRATAERLACNGVDAIITDRPDLLRGTLCTRN